MRAILRLYRQSPRKVRLLVDEIRGKTVSRALLFLDISGKRGARPLRKLLKSAAANAKNSGFISDESKLFVKEIRVDKGDMLHRFRPRARGAAYPISKETSNISLILGAKEKAQSREPRISNHEKAKTDKKEE